VFGVGDYLLSLFESAADLGLSIEGTDADLHWTESGAPAIEQPYASTLLVPMQRRRWNPQYVFRGLQVDGDIGQAPDGEPFWNLLKGDVHPTLFGEAVGNQFQTGYMTFQYPLCPGIDDLQHGRSRHDHRSRIHFARNDQTIYRTLQCKVIDLCLDGRQVRLGTAQFQLRGLQVGLRGMLLFDQRAGRGHFLIDLVLTYLFLASKFHIALLFPFRQFQSHNYILQSGTRGPNGLFRPPYRQMPTAQTLLEIHRIHHSQNLIRLHAGAFVHFEIQQAPTAAGADIVAAQGLDGAHPETGGMQISTARCHRDDLHRR